MTQKGQSQMLHLAGTRALTEICASFSKWIW